MVLHKKQVIQGMTLIETMVTIFIVSTIMIGFTMLFIRLWNVYGFTMETGIATRIATRSVDDVVEHMRKARSSENGSFPIVSAKDNELIFYSDYDEDGVVERVRYFAEAQQLKVGVIEPDMSSIPVNYNDDTETVRTVANDVVNDTVLNTSSCIEYTLSSDVNGTPGSRFTSIGMARNVGGAGEYFFSIGGHHFQTQITSDGWALVASGNRSTNENSYQETSSLGYDADRTLTSDIIGSLSNITEVRMEATNGNYRPFDVVTSDAGVISRLQAYQTLGYNTSHNSVVWTGDGTNRLSSISCDGGSSSLKNKLYHACGNSTGMHWIPQVGTRREQVNYSDESCWWWWCSMGENDLNLYVRAPSEVTTFYVIASKQPDGSFLGDNSVSYSETELQAQGAICTASDIPEDDAELPIFTYFNDFEALFAALPSQDPDSEDKNNNAVFDYDDIEPVKLTPASAGESVNVADVKLIKILLHINPDPNQAPENIQVQSFVNVRNLSTYDTISS